MKAFWTGMFMGAMLGASFSIFYLDNDKNHQISKNLINKSRETKTVMKNLGEEIIEDISGK